MSRSSNVMASDCETLFAPFLCLLLGSVDEHSCVAFPERTLRRAILAVERLSWPWGDPDARHPRIWLQRIPTDTSRRGGIRQWSKIRDHPQDFDELLPEGLTGANA
jgi:hypothetical protein